MKFGGTSVRDSAAFARVADIVAGESANSPVVVTSAMSKVTDALLSAFETAKNGDSRGGFASLEEHFARHSQVADDLLKPEGRSAFAVETELARKELADLLLRAERRSLPLAMLR